jgi:hypothetical protein
VDPSSDPVPAWVTETELPPFDAQIGKQFLTFFPPERPMNAAIVEALDSEQKEITQLAVSSIRAMGDISFVVPLLSREEPVKRRSAVRVLRSYLGEGEEAARALHKQLESDFGRDQGERIEKLLIGYTDEEARDPKAKVFATLVEMLKAKDDNLAMRELALDNLQTLTGRDDLGYNPVKPEGNGLRAWQGLLNNNELKPVSTPKAKKEPENPRR